MRKRAVTSLAFLGAFLAAAQAFAQADWPQAVSGMSGRVKPGQTVYVTDARSRETEGRLVSLSEAGITIDVKGESRNFMSDDVLGVARRGDSLLNGIAFGAAATGGFVLLATIPAGGCAEAGAGGCAAALATAMGVGAAIGALVDGAIKGKTVVYQAPPSRGVRVSPVLTRSGAGVQLAIRF